MNKKLKLFFIICFCLVPSFGSFAEDSVVNKPVVESGTKDEKGCYTSGTIISWDESSGYAGRYILSGTNLYCVVSGDSFSIRASEGSHYSSDWFNTNGNVWVNDKVNASFGGDGIYDAISVSPKHTLYGSIPIFDSSKSDFKESVKKYLENGDCSGAENKYDVSQPSQDDSVELPTNLRTYGKYGYKQDNAMTVRWDVPSDVNNYTYDVRIKVDYSTKDKDGSTDWYNAVTDYPYERNDQYDLNTGKPISRNTSIPEDFKVNRDVVSSIDFNGDGSYVRTIRSIHVEVRNRLDNKCSNWVSVEAQVDGDNSTNVKDNNGNVVQDDIYNGQNTNNSNHETQYDTDPDFSKEDPKFSLSDFFNYLKSGFGLMGSNGLFAFFQRSFSFIPKDIWTLIIAGVACMIIVGIVNFALKR